MSVVVKPLIAMVLVMMARCHAQTGVTLTPVNKIGYSVEINAWC